MTEGLAQVPEGSNVVVMSRAEPPAEYASLLASDAIAMLDGEQLRLTLPEAKAIAHKRGVEGEAAVELLHERSHGWAAGFTLLLTRTRRPSDPQADDDESMQHVFGYFAQRVFDGAAPESGGVLAVALEAATLDAPLTVSTRTLPAGRYVCLRVADSGSGIEPDVLGRIFDPFFTTKQVGVGTGLGLSLVHGIVTDLAGGIAVHSRVGQGTTFTAYLPWQDCQAAHAAADESIPPGEGETVLIVDDEEALVQLGEETLAELGYEPVGFTSAAQALEAFLAEPERFDALLSDEAMPGMAGSELASEMRRLRPALPIVLMTGFVNAAIAARARDAGAADVLVKPLASRDIARCLAAVFRREAVRAVAPFQR